MIPAFSNLVEFSQYFSSEEKCRNYLEFILWEGIPRCPHCDSYNSYQYRNKKTYKCRSCKNNYTVLVKTVFENSKIPLQKWFMAIYLDTQHKKGISSLQLSKDIGVTQKTSWFLLHRIREMFKQEHKILEEVVILDESFIGGKNRNRHFDKKVPQCTGRAFKDKTPVLGMLELNGELRAYVVPNTQSSTLRPIILKNIALKSCLVTDEWKGYKRLDRFYQHEIVNHKVRQYVNFDGFTTNKLECAWAILKRMIIGIYHSVSQKHLQRYVNEFVFRYNTRESKVSVRFDTALKASPGRLKYKSLVSSKAA
jgi:transposase-like protein